MGLSSYSIELFENATIKVHWSLIDFSNHYQIASIGSNRSGFLPQQTIFPHRWVTKYKIVSNQSRFMNILKEMDDEVLG